MGKAVLLAAAIAALCAFRADGAAWTWTGGGDGTTWSQPANWGVDEGFPDAEDAAVAFPADATVDIADAVSVQSISAAAGVTLTLKGSGLLSVGANSLNIGAGARLFLRVPMVASTAQLMVSNAGEFHCHSGVTNAFATSERGLVISGGTNLFGDGADVSVKTRIFFGEGYAAGNEYRIEGNARIAALVLALSYSKTCRRVHVVQDGADSVVEVSTLATAGNSTRIDASYALLDGTLTANYVYVGSASSSGLGQPADVLVSGGTATIGTLDLCYGEFTHVAGELSISSYRNTTGSASARFVLGGADTKFPASVSSVAVDFLPTADVTLEPDRAFTYVVAPNARTPRSLVIGENATVSIPDGTTWAGETCDPLPVTIRSSGRLFIDDQRGYLMQPIALAIESGCTGGIGTTANSARLARSAFVCHSADFAGTALAAGKCHAFRDAPVSSYRTEGNDASSVIVPYVWTGGGDGSTFADAANWSGGACPPSAQGTAIDLSRAAGRAISLPDAGLTLGHVVFMPKGEAQKVTLTGGPLALSIALTYTAAFVVAEGATVELDVDARWSGSSSAVPTLVGGGTVCVKRGFHGGSATRPSLALDGSVTFAGATQIGDATGALADFSMGACGPHHHFDVCIADGASLTARNILFGAEGHQYPDFLRQTGGEVSVEGVYVSPFAQVSSGHGYYRMDGGTLTAAAGVYVGTLPAANRRQYPGGRFIMNGGSIAAPLLGIELNSNFFTLTGGHVFLGAGGFEKTDTYGSNASTAKKWTANTEPGLQFGGVTFHADTAGWSIPSTLDVALTGDGGETTFDIANDVTIASSITGAGGLVKRGTGNLVVAGGYSATGAIRVKGGALSFTGAVSGVAEVDLASADSLSLPEGVSLTVDALLIAGARCAKGTAVTCGGGQVVVGGGADYAWVGESGGRWGDAANWLGGAVPDGEGVSVDFAQSAIPAQGLEIVIDRAVTLAGIAGCGDIALTGEGVLTLADGAVLDLPDGASLTLGGIVHLAQGATKTGMGRLAVSGLLRSAAAPEGLAAGDGQYAFRVAEGEVELSGEAAGLRLYADGETAAADALVTIAEGAVVTNVASLNLPYCGEGRAGYGRIVQNGGTVDLTSGYPVYGWAEKRIWSLAYCRGGESSLTLNGGTMRWPDAQSTAYILNMNSGDILDNGADISLTVNEGASLELANRCYLGSATGGKDTLTLNGGELYYSALSQQVYGESAISLNGGVFRQRGSREMAVPESAAIAENMTIRIGGEVQLRQDGAASVQEFACAVVGKGKIVQAGSGTVRLGDAFAADCDFEARGGTLVLTATALADAGDNAVSVSDGAAIDLDFEGEQTVGSVLVNGRLRRKDTYSANSFPSRFTGGGTLRAAICAERLGAVFLIR